MYINQLQQLLPFTVLKLFELSYHFGNNLVATALTVYGIETKLLENPSFEGQKVATALTVYGIETNKRLPSTWL